MLNLPNIIVPIIDSKNIYNKNIQDELKNKRSIVFGVPGAFTPTCSEKHLPGFIDLYDSIRNKNIEEIYCFSVNDPYVLKSWLFSYTSNKLIKGIADGNAEISKILNLISDKSNNFMGLRCKRFAMLIDNNQIIWNLVEESNQFKVSAAENVLSNL
tara:strand:- start:87 stop:554 length:468 start_codon:yes stop_codon:yes gene_type:complete